MKIHRLYQLVLAQPVKLTVVCTKPHLQDCPLSFSMCPAPLGPVGDRAAECGGNGRCIRSQRVCDCFTG